MDLFKAIISKNPAEFEEAAKILVNSPDIELFEKLVKQDDFLFDFVKNNVAKRIYNACNKGNYKNLLKFFDYYSPSYDDVIAQVLFDLGEGELNGAVKELYLNGSNSQKSYAAKYLMHLNNEEITDLLPAIRQVLP